MKIRSEIIQDFINDFYLENNEEVVCFDAKIVYVDKRHTIQMESEVQIIPILHRKIYIIHILSPDAYKYGVPDMLDDNKRLFSYLKNECLLIRGKGAEGGRYVISIYPLNNNCNENTLTEIHQKHHN